VSGSRSDNAESDLLNSVAFSQISLQDIRAVRAPFRRPPRLDAATSMDYIRFVIKNGIRRANLLSGKVAVPKRQMRPKKDLGNHPSAPVLVTGFLFLVCSFKGGFISYLPSPAIWRIG
jgi:hypothetical protein